MLALVLIGCTSLDAPETLEELMTFGLLNFEDDQALESFANRAAGELEVNGRALRSGVRVDSLTAVDLVENGLTTDVQDGSEVIGVSASLSFDSDFDSVVRTLTGDMSLVSPTTTRYDTVGVVDADRDCFLSRSCSSLDFDVSRDVGGFWGTATQEVTVQFRWVDLADGGEMFLFRGLAPEPFETNSVLYTTNQHYQFYGMLQTADGPTKLEAHWVDAEVVGVRPPDSVLADGAVNSMHEHRDYIDDFIDSGDLN